MENLMPKIVKIDKEKLKKQIEGGLCVNFTAMAYGVSPTTIRRKAKELGLKFENKTTWNKKT